MLDANGNDGRDLVHDVHPVARVNPARVVVSAAPIPGRKCSVKTEKRCIYCKEVKPASEFHRHAYVTKRGWVGERFNSSCKQCHGERAAARKKKPAYRAQQSEYVKRNKKRITERHREYAKSVPSHVKHGYTIKSKYGITGAQYAAMVAAQGGVCKACGLPPKQMRRGKGRLHVDHCHATGKVRGLLCHHCNVTLGLVNESSEILTALISYLRESGG
jgi:hypothetical protein